MQNRISSLNAEELHYINGGGENDGEGFAIAATGLAVVGTALWVLFDYGWLSFDNPTLNTWIAILALSLVLAVGLSWSIVRRRLTGQADVDDVDA